MAIINDSWYLMLLASVAGLRLVELWLSARHQARLSAEGAVKVYEPYYPLMVAVHVGLFIGSAVEVTFCTRPFLPWLGWPMLVLLFLCVVGRLWIWQTLGEQWNVQIMTSSRPIIDTGPYRYVRHPNYTIVIIEIFALPLAHSAYVTALLCSVANTLVLRRRICQEEAALLTRPGYRSRMATKPRFLPLSLRAR